MKVLLKSTADLLNEDLNLVERGILITLLLCKDDNPKITYAKFRVHVKMRDIKENLIQLQDKGYIKWSGYRAAKKSLNDTELNIKVREVIIFFNKTCKRNFDFNSESTVKNLRERLKDYSIEDIKLVIANRYREWRDDMEMSKHLNPTTLFRPSKFDKYLEEAKRTKVGESLIAASHIDLKDGDEITYEISQKLSDTDLYNIKIYQTDGQGNRRSKGINATRKGKDIKKQLKLSKLTEVREYKYYYRAL